MYSRNVNFIFSYSLVRQGEYSKYTTNLRSFLLYLSMFSKAAKYYIQKKTSKCRSNIRQKLNVHSVPEHIQYAVENHISTE
jgi:hypothetical protein